MTDTTDLPLHLPAAHLRHPRRGALTDAFALISDPPDTIADALRYQLVVAAGAVHGAQLRLADGAAVPIQERILSEGPLDLDGRDDQPPATAILLAPADPREIGVLAADPDRDLAVAIAITRSEAAVDRAHIVLIGVGPHPIRARQIEGALRGRRLTDPMIDLAAQTARSEAQPYGVGDLTDPAPIDALQALTRQALRRLSDQS